MLSFVDLLLISLASGGVFLLLLILVSFVLSARRTSALESTIEDLNSKITIQNATIDQLTAELSNLNSKLSNTQKTVSYLAKNQDDIIDSYEALKKKLSRLDNKQEEQQKLIVQNTPESQAIKQATALIRKGMTQEEVARRTNLNPTELEMLFAVTKKEMLKEKKEAAAAAAATASTAAKEQVKEAAAEPVQIQVQEDMSFTQPLPSAHKVAGRKARNAYGMGSSKSLISKNR